MAERKQAKRDHVAETGVFVEPCKWGSPQCFLCDTTKYVAMLTFRRVHDERLEQSTSIQLCAACRQRASEAARG